ncbi:eukaryotic translation initiation factor 3 subunit A-like [Podarcis raffonei]|uniref:eukaryotic translation initiation factor 3 subunit A-like n=1 Tax=Podarcis raffonei TaxID=65483 RepID=UPI0023298ECA|nr:eukaryotic translation initiation factor 3 subunit A-like [Podarcis raffonei]
MARNTHCRDRGGCAGREKGEEAREQKKAKEDPGKKPFTPTQETISERKQVTQASGKEKEKGGGGGGGRSSPSSNRRGKEKGSKPRRHLLSGDPAEVALPSAASAPSIAQAARRRWEKGAGRRAGGQVGGAESGGRDRIAPLDCQTRKPAERKRGVLAQHEGKTTSRPGRWSASLCCLPSPPRSRRRGSARASAPPLDDALPGEGAGRRRRGGGEKGKGAAPLRQVKGPCGLGEPPPLSQRPLAANSVCPAPQTRRCFGTPPCASMRFCAPNSEPKCLPKLKVLHRWKRISQAPTLRKGVLEGLKKWQQVSTWHPSDVTGLRHPSVP